MKKTFCDRCKKEVDGKPVQRYTIFDNNRAVDLCDGCYSYFYKWMHSLEEAEPDIVDGENLDPM